MVLRRTKHGDQLARAGLGRWCAKAEASFFATLGETACVRAAACGFSTVALYQRREAYPEFAETWDRTVAAAKARIPDMLAAATIASLDPEVAANADGARGCPRINVDQAIRIGAIEAKKAAAGMRRDRDWRAVQRKHEETQEEPVQTVMTLLDGMERRQRKTRLGEGWSKTEEGVWIPPGWVREGGADRATEKE